MSATMSMKDFGELCDLTSEYYEDFSNYPWLLATRHCDTKQRFMNIITNNIVERPFKNFNIIEFRNYCKQNYPQIELLN
jgi:hypothetical protein